MRILIDTQAPHDDDPETALLRLADRIRKREVTVRKVWLNGTWELSTTVHDDAVKKIMTKKED